MNIQDFIAKSRREAVPSAISVILSSVGQYYRFPEIRHLRQLTRAYEIDCVFDVGANEGQYAKMLRRWVGYKGRIVSFEPNPIVLEKLYQASAKDPLWTVEPVALSSVAGQITFNATSDSQFGSIEKPIQNESTILRDHLSISQTINVECETLTSAFSRLREDFKFERPMLKLDTQGHDLSVFRSGLDVVDQFLALQSELSFVPFYDDVPLYDEILNEYKSNNFEICAIFQNNRGGFPVMREMDCLLINKLFI